MFLSRVERLPPWPGRKVGINETDCSLTGVLRPSDPSMLRGLLDSWYLFGGKSHL